MKIVDPSQRPGNRNRQILDAGLTTGSSSPSHAIYNDVDDDDYGDYAWGNVPRRTKFKSSKEHGPVVRACASYLKAWILSGCAGSESSPWPDTNKPWFSDRIVEAWKEMALRLGRRPGEKRKGVKARPEDAEARKVRSVLEFVY